MGKSIHLLINLAAMQKDLLLFLILKLWWLVYEVCWVLLNFGQVW